MMIEKAPFIGIDRYFFSKTENTPFRRKPTTKVVPFWRYRKPPLGYNPLVKKRKIKVIKGKAIKRIPIVSSKKNKVVSRLDTSKEVVLEVKKPLRKIPKETFVKKPQYPVKVRLSKPSKKEVSSIRKLVKKTENTQNHRKKDKNSSGGKLLKITLVVGAVGLIGLGIYSYVHKNKIKE